jgi:ATP-dependent RNA helicase DeaD
MTILFNELPILDKTKEAINALGFETLTPIQAEAIPVAMTGQDIIGQAQTGTGKTFAFGIPMLEKIDPNLRLTQGLIICPTRELATQVYKEILKLVKFNKEINATLIVGGESYEGQFRALKRHPQIVVATPGRIIDHMTRGTINVSTVTTLALDEADEMLKMGFQEDMENIMANINETRQILLFSATMPPAIKKIAKTYQHNPQIIKIESSALTVEQIKQYYYIVKREQKLPLIPRILDMTNSKSTIIFSNTKVDVDRITEYLTDQGYLADALHGDIKQRSRSDVMKRFRDRNLEVLVGTDVAARGLDVDDVELVINYDLPFEQEVYVHRIGRTGRAGKNGLAYSFITPRKQNQVRDLEYFIKDKITFQEFPSVEDIKTQQMILFKEELKSMVKQPVKNHLESIEDLLEITTKEQLINILLDKVIPNNKQYDAIEAINPKKPRTQQPGNKGKNSRGRGNSDAYVDFVINIGRKDKVTPPKLLKFMDDSFGIFQKNIGDIKLEGTQTVFGIRKSAVTRLKKKSSVYQGKKVFIKSI